MRPIVMTGTVLIVSMISLSAANAQAMRMACHVDTLCAGVESGGGRIMNCLRAHKTELSEKCLAAIGRSVMNWRSKGGQPGGDMEGGPGEPPPGAGPGPGGPPGGPGGSPDAPQ